MQDRSGPGNGLRPRVRRQHAIYIFSLAAGASGAGIGGRGTLTLNAQFLSMLTEHESGQEQCDHFTVLSN